MSNSWNKVWSPDEIGARNYTAVFLFRLLTVAGFIGLLPLQAALAREVFRFAFSMSNTAPTPFTAIVRSIEAFPVSSFLGTGLFLVGSALWIGFDTYLHRNGYET